MFTLLQIKTAHSRVKSGADFPSYIQQMKTLGVLSYEHYVSDGHIRYYGSNDFTLSGDAKWSGVKISETGNEVGLKYALSIHQQGQTDYPTFCTQAAEAGVEKWTVDMQAMTCTYFDKAGKEMLVESIPMP
jgi:uncharacterized protein YbcV (DUF1398 family)